MIAGIGVDITDIDRVQKAAGRRDGFAERILTAAEYAVYQTLSEKRQGEYLTGRFSAKESYSKAYGTGFGPIGFQDIEILDNDKGRPVVTKHPFAGIAHVSISHTDTMAMTEVILERSDT
ncbi:holo-ACP synthase [Schleiferilactobacillus harbinensis]|jgi:holo-[acyl-carrier protein] synthase|nr:holo-ACP synthase [Schleiferilactobacillus harbinensis]HAY53194.1 holo-ACP synthase [Lactobacillus sp.]MBO3091514.1 holo-ACP synthase [Schleiferilactobacillus harbinensis]MCI1687578.1 holo-ACP synthase [Schleiferilactobacillus harbinensis]MCI1784351.1 holo-ACP synthase [Schleiferilactobacillus harbinensis]MCI1851125.1 holo-ACP synthase [Schleiferilactobacillus harbinensis]